MEWKEFNHRENVKFQWGMLTDYTFIGRYTEINYITLIFICKIDRCQSVLFVELKGVNEAVLCKFLYILKDSYTVYDNLQMMFAKSDQ